MVKQKLLSQQYEDVSVIDWKGFEKVLHVQAGESVKRIGKGTRASVWKVLASEDTAPSDEMAMKVMDDPQRMMRALEGYQALKRRLPREEQERLIKDFYVDIQGNRIFMTLLNKTKWVVSMGKNESADRTALNQNKLTDIPNFHEFVEKFLNAIDKSSQQSFAIGPDVYFFTIDHEKKDMDYVYADTETANERHNYSETRIPLMNLYWAGGALNHFLQECVQDPKMYLARVRQEILHRMQGYSLMNDHAQASIEDFGKDFEWPKLNWKETIASVTTWIGTLIKRQVKDSLNS